MKGLLMWLERWLERWLGRRVPIALPAKPMDSAALAAALHAGKGTPTWDAMMQVLYDNYQSVQGQISNPDIAKNAGDMAFAAGGMSWLGNAIVELETRAAKG